MFYGNQLFVRLPNGKFQSNTGRVFDTEEQAVSDAINPRASMTDAGQAPVSAPPQAASTPRPPSTPPTPQNASQGRSGGLMGLLGGGSGSEGRGGDVLSGLGAGLLAMSMNPGLQRLGLSQMEQLGVERKERKAQASTNRTVQWLRDQGRNDLADLAAANPALIGEAVNTVLAVRKDDTPDSFKTLQMRAEAAGLVPGTPAYKAFMEKGGADRSPLVSIGQIGDSQPELWKGLYEGTATAVNAQADRLPELQQTMGQIETLIRLGDVMDTTTQIPPSLRGFVPEGVSSPIDAYNAIAYGVAQGLRVPGSGPMTDNDFAVLVSRAGSVSSDPASRAIVQSGLKKALQLNMDYAKAAAKFRNNPSDAAYATYQKEIEALSNQRLFNDEQFNILTGSMPTSVADMSPEMQTFYQQLPTSRKRLFADMTKEDQMAAYQEWLREQTR